MRTSDSSLPVIKQGIVDNTGILVTSNNNAAVENISTELPRRTEIDAEMFKDADYLAPVANDVARAFGDIDPDCWGLLALRLGNKANVEASMRGSISLIAKIETSRRRRMGFMSTSPGILPVLMTGLRPRLIFRRGRQILISRWRSAKVEIQQQA